MGRSGVSANCFNLNASTPLSALSYEEDDRSTHWLRQANHRISGLAHEKTRVLPCLGNFFALQVPAVAVDFAFTRFVSGCNVTSDAPKGRNFTCPTKHVTTSRLTSRPLRLRLRCRAACSGRSVRRRAHVIDGARR